MGKTSFDENNTCRYDFGCELRLLNDTFEDRGMFNLLRILGLCSLLLAGCGQSEQKGGSASKEQAVPPKPKPTEWPIFRGDAALTGIAKDELPSALDLIWTFKTGAAVKSSPVIAEGKVFIGSDDMHIYALKADTGEKAWAFKTEGMVEAPPLYANGKVFCGSNDGFLYALNAEDGKLLWNYETADKILGSPNPITVGETNCVLVGSYDNKLHCVDVGTGKAVWTYETGNYINGSPAVSEGVTVFGGCDALLHVLSVTNGTKLKEIDAGAYIAASVVLSSNTAYFGHYENEFLAIDIAKGTNQWRYKDRAFGYFSSAAVLPDRVIFGGRDKRLHCVNRLTGEALWTFGTGGKVDSSPVVAGDKVIVGSDDGRLYLVELATGKELWSYEAGEAIISSPAVAGGKVVVGCEDGNVYAFGKKQEQRTK